jgi:two-component system phosphate regulon sensor histidine kinase PhoR
MLAVFAVSVIGLAYVQYRYLRIGLNLAEVQFTQKIGQSVREIKSDLYFENELTHLVGMSVTGNNTGFRMSLDSIADASEYFMNAFLSGKLIENGIKADFEYRLYDSDSINYLSTLDKAQKTDDPLVYSIQLGGYFNELTRKNFTLDLVFPNVNRYFLSQLNGLIIPSLIFLVFIISVILWVLKSFYWQRSVITTTNDFINNLTHELKTPVFSIGLATKILAENSTEAQKEMIDMIRMQNEKLKTHIDKVLELATLDKKKKILNKFEVDYLPELRQTAEMFAKLCKLEHIAFDYELLGDAYPLYAEVAHLNNAIGNLLDNAMKYRSEKAKISLKAHVENKKLVVEVSDNGIGIAPEKSKKIFDKYYRVSSGDVHHAKGYGLGLYYVKQIVQLHSGKIRLQSSLGEGTEVQIVLPLSAAVEKLKLE